MATHDCLAITARSLPVMVESSLIESFLRPRDCLVCSSSVCTIEPPASTVRREFGGEPVVRAVLLGESNKEIGALLSEDSGNVSKSRLAKIEILDRTEQERELSDGGLESDNLIAEVARQFGLAARTVRNGLTELGPKGEGLVRIYPEKDDKGRNTRFFVRPVKRAAAAVALSSSRLSGGHFVIASQFPTFAASSPDLIRREVAKPARQSCLLKSGGKWNCETSK